MGYLVGLGLIVFAVMLFLYFVPLGLWVSALASGAGVGIF